MITRHHLMLGLLCSLIPGTVIADTNPVLAFFCTGGVLMGSIIPDIHMKRPKKTCLLTVAWVVVQAGRLICIPLLCRVYHRVLRTDCRDDDKRLSHSIMGMLWYSALLGSLVLIPVFLYGILLVEQCATGFAAGLASGIFLHLVQDACTRKGIFPLFPFNGTQVYGSIRPCDVLDRRITGFHVYHGTVLFFFILIQSASDFSFYGMAGFSIFSVALCLVSMVWQAETRIEHDPAAASDNPDIIAT